MSRGPDRKGHRRESDFGIKCCECGLPLHGELNKVPVRILKQMADEMEEGLQKGLMAIYQKDYVRELIHQIRKL